MLRWILDPPLDGPTNMARDEALLALVGEGKSPPTLRFYYWDPPTVSLGYFQSYAGYEALPPPAGRLAVVRRQTGGGAILHDLELTYSLILPVHHPLLGNPRCVEVVARSSRTADPPEASGCGEPAEPAFHNASCLYRHVHAATAKLLAQLGVPVSFGPSDPGHSAQRGPFFCFERHAAFDLLAAGRKIMGSAQRRTRTAILQHGSLILDSRYRQQQCATVREFGSDGFGRQMPEWAAAIAAPCQISPGEWKPKELHLADELRAKYAGVEWTQQR